MASPSSYQVPFIVDERKAGSVLLQQLFGLVDLRVDREVLMLYTSFTALGPGILWSYGSDAQGIGVGSTGGGVDSFEPLGWDALGRDLRLARRWTVRSTSSVSRDACGRGSSTGWLAWTGPRRSPFLLRARAGWRGGAASA